ncbi:hypothetical protein RFM26_24740 [Mesorhizobium sp. VK23B]|uniref:Large polyvalent protein-associated domain-containing protein n=1 Tax=Mesorhizobium dulcispinae TaxID=3072316 RepID=A0ABU4XKM4_9HYPH|nr:MULTISPECIES: hypothetical protein [unclassified Mesorhizobium]MDX8468921.1 hypothetical protein [Mesorhizobium sp. VK23B]MDX8475290.1 hypothetical protein [Mesorhizobium sp. VK23A]
MVHIIPLSVGLRRLDTGNAVQYPDSSPVGAAVQQLGDEWQAVAERYEQRKAQQLAFDTEISARRLNDEIAKAEAAAIANAPADGVGFHDMMYGVVDPRTGRLVQPGLYDKAYDNFVRQAPAEQRPALMARKEAVRASGSRRAAIWEHQARKRYEQDRLVEVQSEGLTAIAKSDPNDAAAFDAVRQTGLDLLAKMDLDPEIRPQAEAAWRASTAKARMEALIAQDPRRAAEMLSAAPATSDGMGETVRSQLGASQGERAAAKGDWRRNEAPDEAIAQAFGNDVPKEEQQVIRRQAETAKLAQEIKIRAAIGRAEAEAPDEIARTGTYSGEIPGEDAYKIIYGRDEGLRRRQGLEWQVDVGKKIFDMGTMTNQAINASVVGTEPGPNASPADHGRHEATAVAAKLVLERRLADSGGYVSDLSPDISAGWKAVFGDWPSDLEAYDQDTYDRTIELSIAKQKALGIDNENLQPVPFSILLKLAEDRDSGSMYFMDNYAKASELFARTKGPVARAALVRELDSAGLGGILPGGKPRLSAGEVFRADANALRKIAANAGIGLANANEWVAYGMSGGTISPPDYKGAYYEPSNNVEKVMMRQGGDALGWAIPLPGAGRVVESTIPRAIEGIGSGAAGQAERSIGNLEAANIPTSKVGPGQVDKLGAGERSAADIPAKPQLEDSSEQPITSLDAAGELRVADSNTNPTTLSPAQDERRTTRPPRKSKLDREMVAAVARELFARDPSRVEHPGAKFGEAATNNYRKGYAQANPDVNIDDLVIHHQAEQQLLKRILDFLSEKRINSVENLRGIPKDLNEILHLIILRRENDEFHARYPHPTEQQILDHSTMMDKKYGHHFIPPVGKNR